MTSRKISELLKIKKIIILCVVDVAPKLQFWMGRFIPDPNIKIMLKVNMKSDIKTWKTNRQTEFQPKSDTSEPEIFEHETEMIEINKINLILIKLRKNNQLYF